MKKKMYYLLFAALLVLSVCTQAAAGECRELDEKLPGLLDDIEFHEPVDVNKEMFGGKLDFETRDLDGNTVDMKDLYAENKITMVSFWGTWCPNCVREMEALAELQTVFQAKGCGIVGVEWEKSDDEETYEKARQIMKECGTNYPNVLIPEDLIEKVSGYPTAYFVDQEGTVLTMPVTGAAPDKYEPALNALLAEEGEKTIVNPDTAVRSGCNIYVKDKNGPVADVMIQICDDNTCSMGATDAQGLAHFDVPADKEYEVHVLVVPDGYQEDETAYQITVQKREIEILLQSHG